MAKVWTIEVGGVAQKYRRVKFQRKLKTNKPAKFEGTIQYNAGIDYWDLVEIKRDGTVEFKGFVEILDIKWDENGRYLYIAGRDTKVILWKKYSDNFSNMHEDTKGFFGRVKVRDLIEFLLRTPKSDFDPDAYPYNKEGWGIDVSKFDDFTAARTSVGDPNYTKLRRRGYGWRNSGDPFASDVFVVDDIICGDGVEPACNGQPAWTPNGVSPYLGVEDDGNFIESNVADATAIFSFDDLPATTTSVERVHLTVVWRPDQTWWSWINSECDVYISPDGGTTWIYKGVFGARESPIRPNPWRHFTFDISDLINTVSKVNNCRVKFVNVSTSLTTNITQAYLSVGYTTSGTQKTYDRFDIPFAEEEIVGIYVESRMDDESYPRNYKIVTVGDRTVWDAVNYTETDPANYIEFQDSNRQIYFDCRQNVDAWLYKDYGVGQIDDFDWTFSFALTSSDANSTHAFQPFCVCNSLMDLKSLMVPLGNGESFIVVGINNTAGTLRIRVARKDQNAGGRYDEDYSDPISLNTEYFIRVVRSGATVTFYVYTDSCMVPESLFYTHSFAIEVAETFRYREHALTYNDAQNLATIGYVYTGDWDETELVSEVTNNAYRDIIHSWTPQTMDNIRIKLTAEDLTCSWAISQVYVYKAESCNYRVYKETGCTPTYAADQYISVLSFDSAYTTALGPLNLPRSRLIDIINTIVNQCHSAYVPYEWWLALDADNTFHFKNQKGGSPAVSFVKGTNLGRVTRTKDVSDTVQRVRIIGRGEGKRQEDVSSDWVEDVTGMGLVNSFYEDIISKKSMVDKTMSELVAEIYLTEEGDPKDQPIITVNNDSYASMAYDVGDNITVTDSLTDTSGLHRIYNITKEVTGDGEVIDIVVDSPERNDADEWAELYRRLKELEVGGVIAADWTGEADKESDVSTEVITTFFEKTAKNDEDAAKRDIKDPSWYMEPNPDGYIAPQDAGPLGAAGPRGTPAQYSYANGRGWVHQNDWMKMIGPDAGNAVQTLMVELRGDTGEEIDVYMRQNPKLVFELKIYEDTGTPVQWYDGDYFDVGLANGATDKGYFFRVKASGGAIFKIYACWNETGTPADTQEQLIRTITRNVKYRLEIITEDNNRLVIFNVYDIDQQQKYPPSVVKTNMDRDMLVRPLYMYLSANDDNSNPNVRAIVYVYKFRTEWEKVQ